MTEPGNTPCVHDPAAFHDHCEICAADQVFMECASLRMMPPRSQIEPGDIFITPNSRMFGLMERPEIREMRTRLAQCPLILEAEAMGFKFTVECPPDSLIDLMALGWVEDHPEPLDSPVKREP